MRKHPVQARSRATVDAIVQAAARILGDGGWAGFTTNKVADAAGVSVGSYYQYFPDKLSLVEAIRHRHLEDSLAVLRNALEGEKSRDEFVEELVRGVIEIHSVNPGLHRVLLDEAPSMERFRDPNSAFEQEYLGLYQVAVARYRTGQGEVNQAMGMVISDAVDGIVHNAARRGTLGASEVRTALIRIVASYLGGMAE